MIALAAALAGLTVPSAYGATGSVRVADTDPRPGRHPGQNGKLSADQQAMAAAAWNFFENNMQADTCFVNSFDGYPSTTMWDLGSNIAGVVSAFELGLIEADRFDQIITCMTDSLYRLPLFHDELPNKAYHTITLEKVDYTNQPGEIGVSAIDLGRLLTWLAIVKRRYPVHAEGIDRSVLRWRFCNVTDREGALYGATLADGGEGVRYLQEGRLGYEEYAAEGFHIWGFNTAAASDLEPMQTTDIYGVSIAYDGRDPREFGAHNYVVTEPYMLAGVEHNWDRDGGADPDNDLWHSDRAGKNLAQQVYRVQKRRWRKTGILTARTEHHLDGPPHFIYDTVYSDGEAWNTLGADGLQYPALAAVSTKAAIGMSILFDSGYTDRLVDSVRPMIDPGRGLQEGYTESTGSPIEARTVNTNGIVLESLLYKVQGKLLPAHRVDTLWDHVPNAEYPGYWQCLSGSAADQQRSSAPDSGKYQITEEGTETLKP